MGVLGDVAHVPILVLVLGSGCVHITEIHPTRCLGFVHFFLCVFLNLAEVVHERHGKFNHIILLDRISGSKQH